jgi:polysaccharide biosynthesis protein PslG
VIALPELRETDSQSPSTPLDSRFSTRWPIPLRQLVEIFRKEEGMKKFLALLAIVGILGGGALTVNAIVACASSTAPSSVPGSTVGFSSGAQLLWESPADQAHDLDLMASTGAKWLRLDFPWPSVQPGPTTWNWGPFDNIVALAKSRGFTILGLPSYTPGWAMAPGATGAAPPANPATFAAFMTALVGRYAPQGIHAWEIWNEPNQAWSWNPPDPAAYTRLLIAASTAVRAADSSATVLTAGLAPAADRPGQEVAPITFVTAIYANGGQPFFDAVAIHPYTYPYLPDDATTSSWSPFYKLAAIHQVMANNGDNAKQIWLTEYGAPTGSGTGAVTEAQQVDMVREAFVAKAQYSFTGPLFWYSGRDNGTNLSDREQNFGLWRNDFSAKPAAAEFDSLVDNVGISTALTINAPN